MRYRWLFGFLFLSQSVLALTCNESAYLQSLLKKQQYQQAIQVLDQCLSASETVAEQDNQLFNDLLARLLDDKNTSEKKIYQHFQTVFSVQPLKQLTIQWSQDLQADYPFADLKKVEEKYYFYYDTGRLKPKGRGIVLTDQAILWRNLLGEAQRVEFKDIQRLSLSHQYGLSLSGWQLHINQVEAIRLSQLPNNTIVPFLSALLYFIQSHSNQDIQLSVPIKEKILLADNQTICYTLVGNPNLNSFNQCLIQYPNVTLSQPDRQKLDELTQAILQKQEIDFNTGYQQFKLLLSMPWYQPMRFKFKPDLQQTILFNQSSENKKDYLFYYDTGRMFSAARGLAFTEKKLLWKNLLSERQEVDFIHIQQIELVYETGISLTGWKLRLNQNPQLDIRLSKLSADNIVLFAKSLVYFINISRKQFFAEQPLLLIITPETQLHLETTFVERHKDEMQAAGSIAIKVGAQLLLQMALF